MSRPPLSAAPFRPDSVQDFAPLREAVSRAGFTEAAVRELLEERIDRDVDLEVALCRTRQPTAFNAMVRLFVLGKKVPEDAARAALGSESTDDLLAVRIIGRESGGVRAAARLKPHGDLLLLGEISSEEGENVSANYVMSGSSPASRSLAALTVRSKVESVLDLGTGSGIQALLAARHAKRVVATDSNPRALNFTAMNARLNGMENISVLEGNFYEPVQGERFDLIVSNPPFIIAPASDFLYQSAAQGDGVSEQVVKEAPAHLREGGYAVCLVSWPHRDDQDWQERPLGWTAGSGCDVWLLLMGDDDPLSYAAGTLRQTESIRSDRYRQRLGDWTEYYRKAGFTRLSKGAVILRRNTSQWNWTRWDAVPTSMKGDASDQIQRIFAAEDLLAADNTDSALLECRMLLHGDHNVEQQLELGSGEWRIKEAELRATRGLGFRAKLDAQVLLFLTMCDGTRPLGEVMKALAEKCSMDPAATVEAGLPIVRRMLRIGMLVPV